MQIFLHPNGTFFSLYYEKILSLIKSLILKSFPSLALTALTQCFIIIKTDAAKVIRHTETLFVLSTSKIGKKNAAEKGITKL